MRNISSALLASFAFLSLSVAAAAPLSTPGSNNCSLHDPQDESVPLCPETGEVLTSLYPAAAVTVSESLVTFDVGVAEKVFGFDGRKLLADTVESFWKGQAGKPPQIFLNGSSRTRDWLIIEMAKRGVGKVDEIAKGITLNPDMVQTQAWTWQQDIMQDGFDRATGRPVMREITPYFGRGTRRIVRTTIARMQQQCGLIPVPSIHKVGPPKSGYAGGNIEGFPGGICVVGSSDLSPEDAADFVPQACGPNSDVVRIETSLLSPGHVDEFVTIVPDKTKTGECAFAVLMADPAFAISALTSAPDQRAMSGVSVSNEQMQKRISSHDGWLRTCSLHHFGRDLVDDILQETRRYEKVSEVLKKSAREPAAERAEFRSPQEQRRMQQMFRAALLEDLKWERTLPKNYFRSDCTELTNEQLLLAFQKPEGRRQPPMDFNAHFYGAQQRNAEVLYRAIKKRLPQCEPEFHSVPQLFMGRAYQLGNSNLPVGQTGAGLTTPPTNGVVIGDRYIMPDPMNEVMREENRKLFNKLGIKLEFANTFGLSMRYGNLHCATNVARYCRPRSRAPASATVSNVKTANVLECQGETVNMRVNYSGAVEVEDIKQGKKCVVQDLQVFNRREGLKNSVKFMGVLRDCELSDSWDSLFETEIRFSSVTEGTGDISVPPGSGSPSCKFAKADVGAFDKIVRAKRAAQK